MRHPPDRRAASTALWRFAEQFAQDLRYAWRGLRQSGSLVLAAVCTLAVGIGFVTVAFAILNAYFLRPYAIRSPYELHQVAWRSEEGGGQRFRWREYEAIRQRRDLFRAAAAESTRLVSSDGRAVAAAMVSPDYFEALGPAMALGRGLGAADAHDAVAVLSHAAWTRFFQNDPSVLGRDIDLGGRRFRIVGVVAAGFAGLGDMPRDVWVPLEAYAPVAARDLIGVYQRPAVDVFVRLQPGVTGGAAGASLTPLIASAADARERSVRAYVFPSPSPRPLSIEMAAALAPVFAAFVLVLVTACANVSNVMLARALARRRETAVRLSLGASRGRIVRQLLTEAMLIAGVASAAALLASPWMLRAGTALLFATLPPSIAGIIRVEPLALDARVFFFSIATAGAATLMFALLPALQASRVAPARGLRGAGSETGGSRLRSALVVGQVAVSLVLVIAAVTLGRNGSAVGSIDLGYEPRGVLSINVRGDNDRLVPPLADALAGDPRVAQVAVTGGNPMFIRSRSIAARPAGAVESVPTRFTFVSAAYFTVLRLPIERGRPFRPDEARQAAPVAIISDATARAFWPGEDPIGRTIRIERRNARELEDLPGYPVVTVVGTVPDAVSGLLVDGPDAGHIYLPMDETSAHATALLVRPTTPHELGPAALQPIFRRVAVDPEVFEVLPLDEMRQLQAYPFVAASWIGSLLGFVALVLSVSGLYGVLSYTAGRRTKEIGIRMALGATAGAVVRLVLGQSSRLAGLGTAIGCSVAFAVFRTLSAVVPLRTVSFLDAGAFAVGLLLVVAAASAAAYQPARRATRVDPWQALKAET